MELILQREQTIGDTTLGDLYVDGTHYCVTLEDAVRVDDESTPTDEGAKVYGKTAIPAGRYNVEITWSPKFQKRMLLIDNVPGFTGIRIHSGNDADDTLGCVLVGVAKINHKRITGGSTVLPPLFGRIDGALTIGQRVHITINNAPSTVLYAGI